MFNMISQGGTFMYIILGVSIIALALFFERVHISISGSN